MVNDNDADINLMKHKEYSKYQENILGEALKLFAINGVNNTSLKDIASHAGITEVVIYKHFKSKNKLVNEIFKFHLERFKNVLIFKSEHGRYPHESIELLISAFFEFSKTDANAFNFIMNQYSTNLKNLSTEFNKLIYIFIKYISRGMSSHYFRQTDSNLAASMIIGLLTNVIFFQTNNMINQNDDEILEKVIDSVFKILR